MIRSEHSRLGGLQRRDHTTAVDHSRPGRELSRLGPSVSSTPGPSQTDRRIASVTTTLQHRYTG